MTNAPVISVILVMRVYALYFRNKWVLAVVCTEAVAAIGIGLVSTFLQFDQDVHIYINLHSGLSLDRSQIPAQAYLRSESVILLKIMTYHERPSLS
jgi:hypothetical protein